MWAVLSAFLKSYHLHFLGEIKISHYLAKFLKILQLIVFLYLHFKQPAVLVTSGNRLVQCGIYPNRSGILKSCAVEMFSYFLKLFVCLCVCVCVCVCVCACVCVHACMKVEAFSVSRYSLWSMFPLSLLWCDVMSVRPLSSRTPESMYFHQCRSAWL